LKGGNLMNNVLLKKKKKFGLNQKYPKQWGILSYEETINLFKKKERLEKQFRNKGTKKIKEELVQRNIGLVYSIARSVFITCPIGIMEFNDLAQEGQIGLMKAIDRFDWKKGFRFSTYATYWIRLYMTRGIGNDSQAIRIPVSMRDRIIQFNKIKTKMAFLLGRLPTNEEIERNMELSPDQSKRLEEAIQGIVSKNVISFDTDFYSHDSHGEPRNRGKLLELIVPEGSLSVFDIVEKKLLEEKLNEVLNFLTPRERFIVKARCGFFNGNCFTLQQVADKLGLTSRERIRQIQDQALKKLRRILKKEFEIYFQNGHYSKE
jgi:RNA polymerase primary sigma factor